jgi:site-specific recombinase XerC
MAYDLKTGWPGVDLKTGWPGVGPATGLKLKDLIEEFLEAAEDGSATDRHGHRFTRAGVRELRWYLDGHVREELGVLDVRELRRDDLEALVFRLGDAGLSRARLQAIVRSVRAMYDYAIERRLARRNPAERVALPEEPEEGSRAAVRPKTRVDRAISLSLLLGTLGFALVALFYIAQTL